MVDSVRTLRQILTDELAICNHGIRCPEECRPPCTKGGELGIIVAALLICKIYPTQVVIVVINPMGIDDLHVQQITTGLLGLLCIGSHLRWLLSLPLFQRFKVMDSTENYNWYVNKPQISSN